MTHTPGPWAALVDEQVPERGACYIHAAGQYGDEVIAEAYRVDADEGGIEQREANARLIAAAPDLLEAARIGLRALREEAPGNLSDIAEIERAIAKAGG